MSTKLMVVIGSFEDEDLIKRVVGIVENGIEKWVRNLCPGEQTAVVCDLNGIAEQESLYNRNDDDDARVSRYKGSSVDTTLLINPTCETLHYELKDFFLSGLTRCFIAFGGIITEETSDWHLQDGLFSFSNFKHILQDSKISSALSESSCKVTISCCKSGSWTGSEDVVKSIFPEPCNITIEIMDPLELLTPVEESTGDSISPSKTPDQKKSSRIEDFSEFLEDGIGMEVGGIFNSLKPPMQEGFLKIRNPCLYIFPSGSGDSAFFAVNGFNMLVNGGASTKPWFWKLIQHVDRVDGVLATHLGSDNLPGLNSLLLRKLQERQVKLPMDNTTPEYQELRRCLISPDLGPLFMNVPGKFFEQICKSGSTSSSPKPNGKMNGASPAPQKDEDTEHPVMKTVDIVKDTLRLSKALNMEVVPLIRKPGTHPEPITLFSKVGLGKLDMYVISPAEGSKELGYVNDKWGCNGKTTTPTGKTGVTNSKGGEGESTVTNLSSICCLLVWHPSNPNERIVRVLFPGNASQTKIFEGLESLKNLPFLKNQFVTKSTLNKQKHAIKTNGSHPAPKTTNRPVANATKKASSAPPKRTPAPASGGPSKREASNAPGRPADKRPKTDKPKGKAPSSAPPKSTTHKAPAKPTKAEAGADKVHATSKSTTSVKKSAPARGASAPPKTDPKRQVTSATKTTKPKSQTVGKQGERPAKKPQTLTPSKSRIEPRRSPARPSSKSTGKKSPEKAVKKAESKVEKPVKKKEEVTVVSTPPEDLTPEFSKEVPPAMKSDMPPQQKSVEPLSTESEEAPHSILSDRHSPEGEDVPREEYAESPPLVIDEKQEEKEEVVDSAPPEKEDTGFIIMEKPEMSEESGAEFISENGSSIEVPKMAESGEGALTEEDLKKQEAQFLSSDQSTPSPEEPPKEEKIISFVEPERENGALETINHAGLGRLPTPFHSLQESSGTTEQSPLSESEESLPIEIEKALETEQMKQEEPEELPVVEKEPEVAVQLNEGLLTPGEEVTDQVKDIASDVHTSFNSSMEGSYELYPTGRSPPPPSDRQETIAETISDFKHDDPPAIQQLADSPGLDTQQQQVDFLEDQTTSTEAPDPHFSVTTTSTESRMARMDSPFSPSEIGQSAVNEPPKPDPALPASESVAELPTNDGIYQDEDVEEPTNVVEKREPQEVLINVHDEEGQRIQVENEDPAEQEEEILLSEGEDLQEKPETPQPELDDPQQAWGPQGDNLDEEHVENERIEDFGGLHSNQEYEVQIERKEEIYLQEQDQFVDEKEDFAPQEQIEGTDNTALEKEKEEPLQTQQSELDDFFGVESSRQEKDQREESLQDEDEDRIQLTGSLASSAQDQCPGAEYSESMSMTETGATPEAEQPAVGFDYDEPNVKDYEQVENEIISKSDLSLSSPVDENFPLHGGTDNKMLLDLNGPDQPQPTAEDFQAFPDTPDDTPEFQQSNEAEVTSPQRYHPAYVDPTAPLADTEDDTSQMKGDSTLDVHAEPFLPKTSVPVDQSPAYAVEADFGQGNEFQTNGSFDGPAAPIGSTNPFMADLLSSDPLDNDFSQEARLPPVRGPDPCAAQDSKTSKVNPKKTGSASTKKSAPASHPFFVDLAYVPNHGNKNSVGLEFFKRLRARYYVISGNDPSRDEPSKEVLNHLLEGKRSWLSEHSSHSHDSEDTNITVIPTHDSNTIREWYQQNFKELEACNIHMVASGSKVLMQDDSIEACKIEF